jgi:prepilin-type processing-associated H-X9-DG protein
MQCTNHLKQFGLALHNYHDTYKSLPSRMWRAWDEGGSVPGNAEYVAGYSALLPYMEFAQVYEMVYPRGGARYFARQWNSQGWANGEGMKAGIPTAVCPSDGEAANKPGNVPGRRNYQFCLGDWGQGSSATVTPQSTRNAFRFNSWVGFQVITDGTSNTIALSEKLIADGSSNFRRNPIRAGDGYEVTGAFSNSAAGNPSVCSGARGTGNSYKIPYTPHTFAENANFDHNVGRNYFEAKTSGFTTIIPPNQPFCSNQTTDQNAIGDRVYIMAPTSGHTGGVNLTMFDGSVTFVSDTIGCGEQGSPVVKPAVNGGTTNGNGQGGINSSPSNYGVWGSAGTPACGETVAL